MFDICLVPTGGANWEQQWSYVISHFQPRNLYTLGSLDPRVNPFKEYIQINTAEEIPGTLVVLSPDNGRYIQGNESLLTFQHPETCCYLFGSDSVPLNEDHLGARIPEHIVYIPHDTPDTMYSFIAGALTFYDRRMKRG